MTSTNTPDITSLFDGPPGAIQRRELFWREHQKWFESCGYMLRPRYKPDWVPSWKGTKKTFAECEDGKAIGHHNLLDAKRISDGKMVMLKRISKKVHPHEAEIGKLFSAAQLREDSRNHCVPIYDVLQVPDEEDTLILVQPFLRLWDEPALDTVGEVVEFLRQVFEALQFMHQHHVAHRDCMTLNIMMDPVIYPKLYHPRADTLTPDMKSFAKHCTRTERPTRYYLIDFGISVKFDADDPHPAAIPIMSGDKSPPEFRDLRSQIEPQDPFPTDIYYLGNVIRLDLLRKYCGLEFVESLIADMVQDDPRARPSMDEVVGRFDVIRSNLRYWKLRKRLVGKEEYPFFKFLKDVRHVYRTAKFIVLRRSPLPIPLPSA